MARYKQAQHVGLTLCEARDIMCMKPSILLFDARQRPYMNYMPGQKYMCLVWRAAANSGQLPTSF